MHTSWGSATDRGSTRHANEDALLAHHPVFVVADGMGGHVGGAVASETAIQEFRALTGRDAVTPDEVHEVFVRITESLRSTVATGGGTTVAGVAVAHHDGPYWLIFNVGDSRVYRLGADGLEQVSVDHSVVQELVEAGSLRPQDAGGHPQRHVITRAVGGHAPAEPDYWLIPAGSGDRLLVCSDGLTDELSDPEIAGVLGDVEDPQAAAQDLVDRALAAGGRDNVSVVVVDASAGRGDVGRTGQGRVRSTPVPQEVVP